MTERILIVDDEPDLEWLITQKFRRQIKEQTFSFEFAGNGREALEKLHQHHDIKLVMTDINMPEMDGLTLLDNLKPFNRPIKAVVVSAYGDLQNIRMAMNRGAFDFITKPLDFNDFEITIYKTLEELDFILESLEARKQLEHEKLEREKAVLHEKMEQEFLANMSHEIRTPLNAINGMTRLLLLREQPQENITYLHGIRQSSDNLIRIIGDILDLSKIRAGKLTFEKITFRPAESLQLMHMTFQFKAEEKGLQLKTEIDSEVPETLLGDPTRLNQILINLVGNALKFTENGGITIRCGLRKRNDQSAIADVEFEISDTGIGMTEEQLGKVFDSFAQASADITRKYGGTGLGLSISKQLVELQRGEIDVRSSIGKGTSFSFHIPFEIPQQVQQSQQLHRPDAEMIARVSKMKALLTEDNEFNQIVAIGLLQSLAPGIQIDCAGNGLEALKKLNGEGLPAGSEKTNYDLILMDIQMPEMDGIEAMRHIRKANNPIPVIAMTAGATPDEMTRCIEAGANDLVAKPFDPNELIYKMAALVVEK